MADEIYFSVTGRNEGKKLVPFFGSVRVGNAYVAVYEDGSELENQLRCILGAMHMANACGFARFDIPEIVQAWKNDRASAGAVLRALKEFRPADGAKTETFASRFINPMPIRTEGSREHLRRVDATSGHPSCEVDGFCRRADRDDE